ncbi:hypothetical protein RN001_011969 [Aquatica leii]|uniref:Uncharacterized protein n=1 Tax=Aquatica leii TaxID=1421715 RepID=A0AAN7P373_9COLE|nr:hypothetical protein RN001_011969 [Aquatica leii]
MDEIPESYKKVRYGDADYEETLIKWYEEKSNSDIDDCQTDEYETSDHDSDSALSENEVNDNVEMSALEDDDTPDADGEENSDKENLQNSPKLATKSYYGKNKFKWSKTAFNKRSQPRQHNIIVQLPGLQPSANLGTACSAKEAWKLLFTDEMLNKILWWTNLKLTSARQKYKDSNRCDLQDLDLIELEDNEIVSDAEQKHHEIKVVKHEEHNYEKDDTQSEPKQTRNKFIASRST